MDRPWILFIAEPEYSLQEYKLLQKEFNTVNYTLERDVDGTGKEAFLTFLDQHSKQKGPIVGIFGGYPQFAPLGGLSAEILDDHRWPGSIKCICLCSVGYNWLDLKSLREKGIQLYNYDDMIQDSGIVANDVADCVLWHVLDGFRKFSSQAHALRSARNTIKARSEIVLEHGENNSPRFEFGHRWKRGTFNESCRNKRCLIMGLGRIGIQCGRKLDSGLGMEIHYTQRNPVTKEQISSDTYIQKWQFHPISELLESDFQDAHGSSPCLETFDCIVICLPGNASTHHMINKTFLSRCKFGVVICNVGRGSIIDDDALQHIMAQEPGRVRHVAMDVFHDELIVEQWLSEDCHYNTITPHIASSTRAVWEASNRLALQVLSHVCASSSSEPSKNSVPGRFGSKPDSEPFSKAPAPARKTSLSQLPRVL